MGLFENIVVVQFSQRQFNELSRQLGYISAADFFKTVPLAEERRHVEAKLKQYSPPKGKPSATALWLHERGIRPLGRSVRESWRVTRMTGALTQYWVITNLLESRNIKRYRAHFRSVEFGSATKWWFNRRTFRFKSHGRWTTVRRGRQLHLGNEGANAIKKTKAYIAVEMRPWFEKKVRWTIEDRLAKV